MKLLITYLKPYKGLVLLALLLAGINQTFSLFDPMIFGKLIDQFANHAKPMPTEVLDLKASLSKASWVCFFYLWVQPW